MTADNNYGMPTVDPQDKLWVAYAEAAMAAKEQKVWMTRAEALEAATTFSMYVPGTKVRRNAWGITVIARNGMHLAFWNGSKKGFTRCR